jgi:hypothetical protein
MEDEAISSGDPFDFADEIPRVGNANRTIAPDRLNRRDEDRPICSRHATLMTCSGTKQEVVYYRCSVKDCDGRQVIVRKPYKQLALKHPQMCPVCKVACEVDVEKSKRTRGYLVLGCACGWQVMVIRPDIQRFKSRSTGSLLDR